MITRGISSNHEEHKGSSNNDNELMRNINKKLIHFTKNLSIQHSDSFHMQKEAKN